MTRQTIAILGGTGPEGKGLAMRWAAAGFSVIIGSRDAARAQRIADELKALVPDGNLTGAANRDAAQQGELVVLTTPFEGQPGLLDEVKEALQGKILVTAVVPLDPAAKRRAPQMAEGPAAVQAQRQVGEGVKVVGAFHNVGAHQLQDPQAEVDCDVLVCGDDRASKDAVIALAEAGGMRAWDAGALANAIIPEGLTSVLININIRYKSKGAGLRITNVPGATQA
ncbi:MAG: NADPH-dependent F420 reductase [Anaerolineae bacterium]